MATFYPFEYLSVLKRWKYVFIIVFLSIATLTTLFALNWSEYSSSATVEIASPEINLNALESNETGANSADVIADLQINRLKQTVLSTNSLAEIIASLGLYSDERQSASVTSLAQKMRNNIHFELIGSSLANSAAANKASAQQLSAIAFTVRFVYHDPVQAQKVVNELVTRFMDEDLKDRREIAEKTSFFLQSQMDELSKSLEEKEAEIAQFRSENGFVPSESLNFNQQASMSMTSGLMSLDSEMTANIGRIGALRAQLAQTDPYTQLIDEEGQIIDTPGAQLRMLETRYASMTAQYGPKHPDVLKTARQINALRDGGNGNNRLADIRNADNPAYLEILAQIEAAQEQQSALRDQRDKMQERQDRYEQAIASNPEAEQRMASLTRDYENTIVLYRDLKAKKLASDINKTIEEGRVGRRLALINPAEVPQSTDPSRKALLAGGLLLALIGAVSSVTLLQLLNHSIIGPHHLKALTGAAPLVRLRRIRRQTETGASKFEKKLSKNRVISHLTRNKAADQFRFLRTQILQTMHDNELQTLAISSPRYGDGKSTVAANLAVSIAQDLQQTVLLVDLDLRNPSIAEIFDIHPELGLTDYLSNKASVKDCLVRPPFERISIFPAGHAIDRSSESLGSPEMKRLAAELRERYDDRIIIYDLPPLLQQDDPLVFLPHVDCFVLTVREGVTTSEEVTRSLEILKSAKVLGIVLNEI